MEILSVLSNDQSLHLQKLFSPTENSAHEGSEMPNHDPAFNMWLCDITLSHHVKHLHNVCLAASLAHENLLSTSGLLLWALS